MPKQSRMTCAVSRGHQVVMHRHCHLFCLCLHMPRWHNPRRIGNKKLVWTTTFKLACFKSFYWKLIYCVFHLCSYSKNTRSNKFWWRWNADDAGGNAEVMMMIMIRRLQFPFSNRPFLETARRRSSHHCWRSESWIRIIRDFIDPYPSPASQRSLLGKMFDQRHQPTQSDLQSTHWQYCTYS